jgi:hypothetical protein
VCRSALCSPLLSSCGILHVTILLCQNNLSLPCEVQTDTTYRQKGMNNFLRHKVVPLPQRRYPLRGLGPWVPLPTGEHHYSRSSAFEPDTGRRGLSARPPCLGSTDGYTESRANRWRFETYGRWALTGQERRRILEREGLLGTA